MARRLVRSVAATLGREDDREDDPQHQESDDHEGENGRPPRHELRTQAQLPHVLHDQSCQRS